MKMNTLAVAAASGWLAVLLGAFGAHGLKPLLSTDMMMAYETGVRYQFYHTAMMLIIAFTAPHSTQLLQRASTFFAAGILLFSGSLYLLAFSSAYGSLWTWLGPVTPLGGLCFMVGWIYVFLYAIKKSKKE